MFVRTTLALAALLASTTARAEALDQAPFARLGESRPAATEGTWTPLKLPSGERIALASVNYLMAVDENWGFGPSVYGSAKGNHGGIFTAGLTAQRRWRLGSSTHVAASLYAGAGGGLSSEQLRFGGGLMLRSELSLRHEWGDWYNGVGISHIRFPSGNVRGTSVALVLGKVGSFASFPPDDAGRRGKAGQRTGLGFDEITLYGGVYEPRSSTRDRSGNPSTLRMGKAGADLRQYIVEGSWWGIEAAGAAQGGRDGYMEVLATAGQDWALGHPSLRAGFQLGLGLGGGGNVDTGNGWIVRAGPTLRWILPTGQSLRLDAGITRAPDGRFSATHAHLGLALPLDQMPRERYSDDVGKVRAQQLALSIQHLPRVRFKDGTRDRVQHIAFLMTRELTSNLYGVAQAGSAAFGKAGAYSFGLFGLGVQSPRIGGGFRVGAEGLVGAAGGGGVLVGGGAVGQVELWTQYEWQRLRVRAGLGQWRALRESAQSSPVVNVSIGYAFGALSR